MPSRLSARRKKYATRGTPFLFRPLPSSPRPSSRRESQVGDRAAEKSVASAHDLQEPECVIEEENARVVAVPPLVPVKSARNANWPASFNAGRKICRSGRCRRAPPGLRERLGPASRRRCERCHNHRYCRRWCRLRRASNATCPKLFSVSGAVNPRPVKLDEHAVAVRRHLPLADDVDERCPVAAQDAGVVADSAHRIAEVGEERRLPQVVQLALSCGENRRSGRCRPAPVGSYGRFASMSCHRRERCPPRRYLRQWCR